MQGSGGRRLVVVLGDEDVFQACIERLSPADYRLYFATELAEAAERIAGQTPEVVVAPVSGAADGVALCRSLKDPIHQKTIGVILLAVDDRQERLGKEAGCDAVLRNATAMDAAEAIAQYLGERRKNARSKTK